MSRPHAAAGRGDPRRGGPAHRERAQGPAHRLRDGHPRRRDGRPAHGAHLRRRAGDGEAAARPRSPACARPRASCAAPSARASACATRPSSCFTYDEGLDASDRVAQLLAEIGRPADARKLRRRRRVAPMLDGVLVVDKPAGPTSHDVVDHVRRSLRKRRVGHTGTLDPFATGVLPVCVGKATRLARFLTAGEKTYRATARLGFATTTDDGTGAPLSAPREVSRGPRPGGGGRAHARGRADAGPARVLRQAQRRRAPLRPGPPRRGRGARCPSASWSTRSTCGARRARRSRWRCAARPGPTCARSPATWASAWARARISWPCAGSAAGRSGRRRRWAGTTCPSAAGRRWSRWRRCSPTSRP